MATVIDTYISQCELPEIRERLLQLQALIREEAPQAEERFSWEMPTFYLYGNVVHFFAHKGHIGFYPGSEGVEPFLPRLEEYKTSKGAIQFPNNKPMPWDLIRDIVRFRVAQNLRWEEEKQAAKEAKKQAAKEAKKQEDK